MNGIIHFMNIGLCGGHRTGKSTLAKAIADRIDKPFVGTTTSQVFQQMGLDPAKPMDFPTRLRVQHQVLLAAEQVWQAEPNPFITDRTPIDMMAYTLADIQGTTEVNFVELEAYMQRCFVSANQFFSQLFVVQPGIPLVYEVGKAALNQAYIEHIHTLVLGLCSDLRLTCPFYCLERQVTDLEERIQTILTVLENLGDCQPTK
ncbi:AAA family ATPase [Tumidithrix helvetica]|uniref:AAA family ATPase n=1 Tax=Tumidithrix helvetica TaxID=3457545 RepID=UPI003CC52F41